METRSFFADSARETGFGGLGWDPAVEASCRRPQSEVWLCDGYDISTICRKRNGDTECRKLAPVAASAAATSAFSSVDVYALRTDVWPSEAAMRETKGATKILKRASGSGLRTRSSKMKRRQERPTFRII